VLIPVVLALVWAGGWGFTALVALAAALMGVEWHRLTLQRLDAGGYAVTAALVLAVVVMPLTPPWGGPAVLLAGAAAALALGRDAGLSWRLLALGWLGLPAIAMVWLRLQPDFGLWLIGWLLATVWASDTGAYFTGRAIGGPKLAPRMSPNKTWAGLLGGMLAAGLAGAGVAAWGDFSALAGGLAAAPVAVLSQGGDLAESALKRQFGVKDSGNLIPGHGGILDRVDALLAAAVVAAALFWLSGGRLPLW
jgi:phosphatidate cytidylyltransferase